MDIRYQIKRYIRQLYRTIDSLQFKLKLNYLCYKYGGGANIPPEKVGKLMGVSTDLSDFHFAIAMKDVCDRFKLDVTETAVGARWARLTHNYCDSQEEEDYSIELIRANPKRRRIFNELLSDRDLTMTKVDFFYATPEAKEELLTWLNEK